MRFLVVDMNMSTEALSMALLNKLAHQIIDSDPEVIFFAEQEAIRENEDVASHSLDHSLRCILNKSYTHLFSEHHDTQTKPGSLNCIRTKAYAKKVEGGHHLQGVRKKVQYIFPRQWFIRNKGGIVTEIFLSSSRIGNTSS